MGTTTSAAPRTQESSCTDIGKENGWLIDKHHIGDFFFFFSVFQVVTFLENSAALPLLSRLKEQTMKTHIMFSVNHNLFHRYLVFAAESDNVYLQDQTLKSMLFFFFLLNIISMYVYIWKLTLSWCEWVFLFFAELICHWCLGKNALAPEWM